MRGHATSPSRCGPRRRRDRGASGGGNRGDWRGRRRRGGGRRGGASSAESDATELIERWIRKPRKRVFSDFRVFRAELGAVDAGGEPTRADGERGGNAPPVDLGCYSRGRALTRSRRCKTCQGLRVDLVSRWNGKLPTPSWEHLEMSGLMHESAPRNAA